MEISGMTEALAKMPIKRVQSLTGIQAEAAGASCDLSAHSESYGTVLSVAWPPKTTIPVESADIVATSLSNRVVFPFSF
jgi:hypothetical protein